MPFTPYHNILGASGTDQVLIASDFNSGKVKSVVLTNVHSADATVSLSIRSYPGGSEIYYLVKDLDIPISVSNEIYLGLDSFRRSDHELVITVGATDKIDVIIKR